MKNVKVFWTDSKWCWWAYRGKCRFKHSSCSQ